MAASAKILDHESRTPMPSLTKIQATAEGFAKVRHNATEGAIRISTSKRTFFGVAMRI